MTKSDADEIDVLGAVRKMSAAQSADEIVQIFANSISPLGVTGVLIGHIVDYETLKNGQPMRLGTWPTELMRARIENRAVIHDPVIAYALRTSRPFRWETAYQHASRYGLKIANLAEDYGLKDGIMFPIISVEATRGGVSIGGAKLAVQSEQIMPLSLLANHCYVALERMLGPFRFEIKASLSALETDVLHYAACGKSAWETSQILHMTEGAVKASIKRARHKLGAVNTPQAVASAMRQNLLV